MFRISISVDPAQWHTQEGRSILERANYIILMWKLSHPTHPLQQSRVSTKYHSFPTSALHVYDYNLSLCLCLSLRDPLGVIIRLGVV